MKSVSLNTGSFSINDLTFYLIPFVNSMPEGFIMIDRSAQILIANSKSCEMFGYKDSELVGQNLSILVPSIYNNVHKKHVEGFFTSPHARSMGAVGMQLYGLKKNGIHFPIEVSLGHYNAKEGTYAMAFIVDITAKQHLDNALKQSEQRFSQIFQATPVAICIMNSDRKRFMDVNDRFSEITKYSKEEVVGGTSLNLQSILTNESFEKISDLLDKSNKIKDLEANLETKTGNIIDILISIEKIVLSIGTSYIVMFSDISDRKRAEKQLEAERNFIKAVDETVDALIIVQDVKGRIISFNKVCENISGYKFKEVKNKISWNLPLLPKDQVEIVKEAFESLKNKGGTEKHENYWVTKSGEKRLIRWSNTTLKDEKGDIVYIIRTGVDITESKKHELELLNAIVQGEEKERTRLAKELHDGLSPILSSVRNNLEAVEIDSEKLDPKKHKYFSNSMSLLKTALDEVRTISKDLMPSVLEDYGLVIALKQLCERMNKTNNIEINFYSTGSEKKFNNLIEIGLYRIAQELINNSMKHSNTKTINVHVVKHKKSIVLSVEDTGKGFVIAENMSKGLGLKNIASRVKSLDGFISMDSRLHKGTLVTVEIPIK